MYIQQIYTNCLAQAAYYIESEGEAVIIDPLRDIDAYLKLAESRGAKIKYVFETHFHADFVSGHLELARKTGAVIVFGPTAKPGYEAMIAKDHEKIKLGNIQLEVLHTPGHTIESSCLLLHDEQGKAQSIFTGDTLFVGDVGRPDLMSGNLSKEELAAMLFDSLHSKIKTLDDAVLVYPGHGAGSACGKNIGKETTSTIGEQKQNNYALKENDKDKFIQAVTSGLPAPPPYFFKDAVINISGYDSLELSLKESMKALSVEEFKAELEKGATVLDTRTADLFAEEFIPGSINIGLNGDYAVWAGTIIHFNSPLVLVCEKGKEQESVIRLARIGYDNIKGHLAGGIETWVYAGNKSDQVTCLELNELKTFLLSKEYVLIDVRREDEYSAAKIKDAVNIPLHILSTQLNTLDKNKKYLIHCAGGYRSMIAVSMLKANGINEVYNVVGGISKVKNEAPELLSN